MNRQKKANNQHGLGLGCLSCVRLPIYDCGFGGFLSWCARVGSKPEMLCGSGSENTKILVRKESLVGPLTCVLGVSQTARPKPFLRYVQSTVERFISLRYKPPNCMLDISEA